MNTTANDTAQAVRLVALNEEQATTYVHILTGSPDSVMDWRALKHDDKQDPGHARRGTLTEWWPWMCAMQEQGYGIFAVVSALDGHGRSLPNVQTIRAHYVDLDSLSAVADLGRAVQSVPPPAFSVESSPGKHHVYWTVQPYPADLDRFSDLQRRLRQTFNGDPAVSDATRVMRLPGTVNWKHPGGHLVTMTGQPGWGQPLAMETLEAAYAHVTVTGGSGGERHQLGDPDLAAPSLEWIKYALAQFDPNTLDRAEWIAITSAVKQAGWTLTDDATLRAVWDEWCARYDANDPGENNKQWNSIRDTQLGWKSLAGRSPGLRAATAGLSQTEPTNMQPTQANGHGVLRATPYSWPDPCTIQPRPWILGHDLMQGELSVVVAPGGVGKSTLAIGKALSLATGRNLLGVPVYQGPHAVWLFNLEDDQQELERQVGAAIRFHSLTRSEVGDRLHINSGLDQPLCVAQQTRDGLTILEPVFEALKAAIRERDVRALIVDPWVSSHQVQENDNGAIDAVAKRWKRLAHQTGCAIELVHHSRKVGGMAVSAEDGRGASALHAAARVVTTLNPMSTDEANTHGINPADRRSFVRIDMGKSNRAPAGAARWIRIAGQSLGNGTIDRPADEVGVATLWTLPEASHGITAEQKQAVLDRLAVGGPYRFNHQSKKEPWFGVLVAEVCELDVIDHRTRIRKIIDLWIADRSISRVDRPFNGDPTPYIIANT